MAGTQGLGPPSIAFPSTISKQLDEKQSSWNMNQHSYRRCQHCRQLLISTMSQYQPQISTSFSKYSVVYNSQVHPNYYIAQHTFATYFCLAPKWWQLQSHFLWGHLCFPTHGLPASNLESRQEQAAIYKGLPMLCHLNQREVKKVRLRETLRKQSG